MQISKILIALVLTLAFVAPAAAKGFRSSGQARRAAVAKYRKARKLSPTFKMRSVKRSRSGKSMHVAVSSAGKVDLLTINSRTGRVANYRNEGLVKQSTARGTAHKLARRERGAKGTFSGVFKSGLSKSGKSFKFNSKTDRNETVYVNLRSGKSRRMDGPYRSRAGLNTFAAGLR